MIPGLAYVPFLHPPSNKVNALKWHEIVEIFAVFTALVEGFAADIEKTGKCALVTQLPPHPSFHVPSSFTCVCLTGDVGIISWTSLK